MLALHYFYQSLELQKDYEHIHKMIKYLNNLCTRLPAYSAPPLYTSADCNMNFHPNHEFRNFSTLNGQGLLTARKDKVPFYLRPRDKFDLHPWIRFNDSVIQESYGIAPERTPPAGLRAEIFHVLDKLRVYIRSQFSPKGVKIIRILDGYIRFNPHLGREYIFTLKLTVQNLDKPAYRKYHLIRELNPQLSIIDQDITPSSTTINVILPLASVGSSFMEFLLSYSHIGLRYGDNKLHLVIVVFSDDQATLVEKVLQQFTADTFQASASLVTTTGTFDRLKAIELGMESIQDENGLAFLADVNLRFGPGFFRRCRLNTELGKRVYFPSAFWLYEMNYKNYSDGSVPSILPWVGQWGAHQLWLVCIYKKDYKAVGGYRNKTFSVDLFKAIIRANLDILQAPDPGLFRTWTKKNCRDLNFKRTKICLKLKRAGSFEQPEMVNALDELGMTRENVLKQSESKDYL